jgi:hypothetical protein
MREEFYVSGIEPWHSRTKEIVTFQELFTPLTKSVKIESRDASSTAVYVLNGSGPI